MWQRRTVNARRRVFLVVGPPKDHTTGHIHPVLVLMSDNRPDTVGRQGSAIEPLLDFQDPDAAYKVLWEEESSMTRIT